MSLLLALIGPALAGYGDPVDGVPNHLEREVHLWTNAVRVAPEAYATDYPCAFGGFLPDEQTAKIPLWWHVNLGSAARAHSEDMASTGVRTHTSSDGTPMTARIGAIYTGSSFGENVAEGYDRDAFGVVVEGWMCSDGHREQIMTAAYQDLGVGVADRFWTQDFGGRDADPLESAARLGLHLPDSPGSSADYKLAVYTGSTPPGDVVVVINGEAHPMLVEVGTQSSGIYTATVAVDADCTAYWFEVDGDHYPEEGAFGFGDCPWGDAEARWLLRAQIPALREDGTDEAGCGCAHGTGGAGWLALVGLIALRRRK